jgi:hypothetical protein
VLCLFHLRTSLKPSSRVAANFGVLDWPVRILALITASNSWRATVYVPYRALNRLFPLRALQRFCLFSAVFTMAEHCSLSATEAEVYPATSSMSPCNLNSFFSCASTSGNCPIELWYSHFRAQRVFVQNDWYPGTGTSAIPDTTLRS